MFSVYGIEPRWSSYCGILLKNPRRMLKANEPSSIFLELDKKMDVEGFSFFGVPIVLTFSSSVLIVIC
jgi:hypothetical protein